MRRSGDGVRDGESGFTVIELLVVAIIISIIFASLIVVMRSSRVGARNAAMKAAAGTIDAGFADFVRIYPPVGGMADPLLTRTPSGAWTNNYSAVNQGLKDETDSQLVKDWPSNPYGNGGVRVFRQGPTANCTLPAPRPGDIAICRKPAAANKANDIVVVAWGANKAGAPVKVYDTTCHGNADASTTCLV